MSDKELQEAIESIKDDVIAWRRHIHKNPELSFKEFETSKFIYEKLESFGNFELSRPTETSVMARLIGDPSGPVVAMRADIDALAMQENSTADYASANDGAMHACGHDTHAAMLLGAAKILSGMKDQIKGEFRFFFQHAEELPPGGASQMVDAGVMEGVDRVIGLHISPMNPCGQIGIGYGAMTADGMNCEIKIKGKGGHSSMPEHCIDPVSIGAQVVLNIQHVVARYSGAFEPLVLGATRFNTPGEAFNVIPDYAVIGLNGRGVTEDFREKIPPFIERIVKGVTDAHGAEYEISFEFTYKAVINDQETTDSVKKTMTRVYGESAIIPAKQMMGGEDFSAYLDKAPGTFITLGAGNEEKGIVYANHHPLFDVDEESFPVGIGFFVFSGLDLLDSLGK